MRPWKNCAELLALFGIDAREKWAARFVDLVEVGALLLHFERGTVSALERGYMKELHLSPLVYWSQMKRAIRPLLAAGGDTLRALGVPVRGDPMTAHELAAALAFVLKEEVDGANAGLAEQIGQRLEYYGFTGNRTERKP